MFEQIDDQVMAASHDNLNRLTQHTPGGPLQFVGTVNEPANVTIAGQPAVVDPTNTFRGPAPTVNGTTTVSITATDPSGNVASRQYEVDVTGAPKTFTYDANGNMTGDGTRTFEWDARNQLVAIQNGNQRFEFEYDGLQRRARSLRRLSGAVQSDDRITWCENVACVTMTSAGSIALDQFGLGYRQNGLSRYSAADHLGSVTSTTDQAAVVTGRYSYDPWGRQSIDLGTGPAPTGYTSHSVLADTEFTMPQFRAYSSHTGRWLSEDPLGIRGGTPNYYQYVSNAPISRWDPYGLRINCVKGTTEERFVGTCPSGSVACTTAKTKTTAGTCRLDAECGTYSFDGQIVLDFLITYTRGKQGRVSDGNTSEVHEDLHIGDIMGSCQALAKIFKTDGFPTVGECLVARGGFLNFSASYIRAIRDVSEQRRDK